MGTAPSSISRLRDGACLVTRRKADCLSHRSAWWCPLPIRCASLWAVPLAEHTQTEADVNRFPVPKARAFNPRFAYDYLLFLSSTDGRDGLWKLENGVSELWKGSEGGVVASPSISPDGREICFSYRKRGRTGLRLMSADATLAESLDVSGAASWSPDQRWVAVAAKEGTGTYVFKLPVDGVPRFG